MPRTSFSDMLRESAEPAWSRATKHRFTRDIANDTVPDQVFVRQLLQSAAIVETLINLVAFAIARAPSLRQSKILAGYLNTLVTDESAFFERTFESLGVGPQERESVELAPVTARLRALMFGTGESGTYEEILTVLLATQWIGLTWAGDVATEEPSRLHLRQWIATRIEPNRHRLLEWLRGELDRAGPDLPDRGRNRLASLFRHTTELEAAFFDAAYATV